jgi:spermidine/putrescine transport system ATP-binding protein
MLELRGICKRFGDHEAVSQVNLTIPNGEFFALLGPSGCGKTTLLRMLAGFEKPSQGEIRLNGQRIDLLPAHQRPFNMVFQKYALFPHLSVFDNVAYGPRARKTPESEVRSRVEELLDLVKMRDWANRRPETLSGGQQQRVALARALINRPQVLLLDEPLSALDLKLRQQMQMELLGLQKQLKLTFILVTHDQDEAMSLSDRIAVMNGGSIQQIGSPREIYDTPRTAFVADFIGTMNQLCGEVHERSENRVAIKLAGGEMLFAPQEKVLQLGSSQRSAIVLVRPEKMKISLEGPTPDTTNLNYMRARVRDVIFKGPIIETVCQPLNSAAAVDLTAPPILVTEYSSERAHTLKPGSEIWLKWNQADGFINE